MEIEWTKLTKGGDELRVREREREREGSKKGKFWLSNFKC